MKNLTILAILVCSIAVGCLYGANISTTPVTAAKPILVELFTSEGCSSCPPADMFLQRLDDKQPIHGAQFIVLSEHVDYFNHDGWTDPYSSPAMTDRQTSYAHALGIASPYTPQILVDGTDELHLDQPQQIIQVFGAATSAPMIPIRIGPVSIATKNPLKLQFHVDVDATSAKHSAYVYTAVALDHAASHVLRGENKGHDLTHVAVVLYLEKIGKAEKGSTFSKDAQIKLKSGMDAQNLRVIVFAQESGPGKIIGAAMQKEATR